MKFEKYYTYDQLKQGNLYQINHINEKDKDCWFSLYPDSDSVDPKDCLGIFKFTELFVFLEKKPILPHGMYATKILTTSGIVGWTTSNIGFYYDEHIGEVPRKFLKATMS
jgi:hypothetical protein